MASIRRRGSAWQVRINRKGTQTIVKTFQTRLEAEQWGRAQEHSLDLHSTEIRTPTKALTFKDLLERYLVYVTPKKRGATDEVWRIKAIMRHEICKVTLTELSGWHAAHYRDDRLKRVSNGTVRREFNLLNHVWSVAESEWALSLPHNPFKDLKLPKAPPARQRVLTQDEWAALMAGTGATRTPWLKPLMVLAYETAMRRSELLGLKRADVDLDTGYLIVRQSKTGHSRVIPLTSVAAATLKSWMGLSNDEQLFAVTPSALLQAFDRLCQRVNIKDFHWHDFRHCATSRFAQMGLSPVELMAMTGHRQLSSLMRYAHLQGHHLSQRINQLGLRHYP